MLLKQLFLRTMSTFTSRTNIITGNNDWIFVDDEEFDYQQELARSAFADMLHDHERNVQYEKAIRKTIRILSKLVKKIHILDIGTGTGLLSMMAARGFDEINDLSYPKRITACEVFQPMANIARKCIEKNNFSECIRVVDKRSTEFDLNIDLQGDSINMIVAEVFDTELIGEGALRTFSEACKHLTTDKENLRIVPARAMMYVQLVESPLLESFHTLKNPFRHHENLSLPNDCRHLAGNTMFDLNVNEIREHIRPLSKPIAVFDFDFKHVKSENNFSEEKILEQIICQADGQVDAFIMWWVLDMDEEGEIQLGTTPIWCLDDQTKSVQWREHWIHGIYYPRETLTVKANDQVSLYCFHDEYSLYFDVGYNSFASRSFIPSLLSRSAVAAFNCSQRREKFTQALEQCLPRTTSVRCLYVGDGLLLPLLVLDQYTNVDLTILQSSNTHLARTLDTILSSNRLKYRMIATLDSSTLEKESIDIVLAEPFFAKSLLPWDNLHFYYLLQQCRPFCHSNVQILPRKARIRCVALEFFHLHKIRSPIHQCSGFNLSPFDEQIMQASLHVDACIEPQPLFEYASRQPSLSSIIDLIHFDFQQNPNDPQTIQKYDLKIPFRQSGICNGLAFWIDFELYDGIWLTTGIENEGDSWVTYCKQGVHLLSKPLIVEAGMTMNVSTGFDFKHGQFLFDIV